MYIYLLLKIPYLTDIFTLTRYKNLDDFSDLKCYVSDYNVSKYCMCNTSNYGLLDLTDRDGK
jgi:hypothetical protein